MRVRQPLFETSESKGGHTQREGTNLGALFPLLRVLRRCEATNLGLFLCHVALISPYSNWAVQIRVGLELADLCMIKYYILRWVEG